VTGREFRAVLDKRPGVKRMSEWHYKLFATDGRVFDLYFNRHHRIRLVFPKASDVRGCSPEYVMRTVGWTLPEIDTPPGAPCSITTN
jgi:hypothetical protein